MPEIEEATGELAETLTEIYERRGKLVGDDVVEEASDPQHPLHNRFEWDNRIAGHKFRVIQAERLIRSVKIEVRPKDESADRFFVRGFVSNRLAGDDKELDGYRPTKEVLQDPLQQQILLRSLERDLLALERRYGHMKEFAKIVQDHFGSAETE